MLTGQWVSFDRAQGSHILGQPVGKENNFEGPSWVKNYNYLAQNVITSCAWHELSKTSTLSDTQFQLLLALTSNSLLHWTASFFWVDLHWHPTSIYTRRPTYVYIKQPISVYTGYLASVYTDTHLLFTLTSSFLLHWHPVSVYTDIQLKFTLDIHLSFTPTSNLNLHWMYSTSVYTDIQHPFTPDIQLLFTSDI